MMAFVVTEPCRGCKHTHCVTVCPADCFREGEEMLYIDPDQCLDCEACAAECPVQAIYSDRAVPTVWREYVELNASMARICPPITEKKET